MKSFASLYNRPILAILAIELTSLVARNRSNGIIAIKSIQDLVKGMEHKKVDTEFVDAVKKLGNFLYDVSDSTIG